MLEKLVISKVRKPKEDLSEIGFVGATFLPDYLLHFLPLIEEEVLMYTKGIGMKSHRIKYKV